jgi:hypothetical protein
LYSAVRYKYQVVYEHSSKVREQAETRATNGAKSAEVYERDQRHDQIGVAIASDIASSVIT